MKLKFSKIGFKDLQKSEFSNKCFWQDPPLSRRTMNYKPSLPLIVTPKKGAGRYISPRPSSLSCGLIITASFCLKFNILHNSVKVLWPKEHTLSWGSSKKTRRPKISLCMMNLCLPVTHCSYSWSHYFGIYQGFYHV